MDRIYVSELEKRMAKERRFIQLVVGPRQVGKTTILLTLKKRHPESVMYVSADDFPLRTDAYIDSAWETCRQREKSSGTMILVFDELQKVPAWNEAVKRNWDKDTRDGVNIKVIVSGSSRLLLQHKMGESLMGRYQVLTIPHWSYAEMNEAFGLTLEQYIYFGGYPGSVSLMDDEYQWCNYINLAFIEPAISQDILMLSPVTKPALLRQTFDLGCLYSAEILSLQKMTGQLQDSGNVTTIANYLSLLSEANLVAGLQKYTASPLRTRASSPKLQVYNNALMSSRSGRMFSEIKSQPETWGRYVESAVGAHLLNLSLTDAIGVYYWRDGNNEIDYVLTKGDAVLGVEVKSGRRNYGSGLAPFTRSFPMASVLVVSESGEGGSMSIAEFFAEKTALFTT